MKHLYVISIMIIYPDISIIQVAVVMKIPRLGILVYCISTTDANIGKWAIIHSDKRSGYSTTTPLAPFSGVMPTDGATANNEDPDILLHFSISDVLSPFNTSFIKCTSSINLYEYEREN